MISDCLSNIFKYGEIPKKTADFILGLNDKTPAGHYEIDENTYVNVDIYETKLPENCRYEAHKKYIDIQLLLKGEEIIEYTPLENLKIKENYDSLKDIAFYYDGTLPVIKLKMQPNFFTVLYPTDAHKPQLKISDAQKVKKVVVKIKTD